MTVFFLGCIIDKKVRTVIYEDRNKHKHVCLDTGHVAVFEDKLDIGDEVRRLGDKLQVLHVHDNKFGEDSHLMPYEGILDWKSFYKALKDIDYKGVFSLETAPSRSLPTYLFDEMGAVLCKIAKEITKED